LRPPVPTDKGSVVAALAGGLRAVCYIGDDEGDRAGFEALEVLRHQGVSTLAVAVRSGIGDETPATLIAAADLIVDGPQGVLGLFQDLLGR
jgi:trehalose 6-phosphate phosphatase